MKNKDFSIDAIKIIFNWLEEHEYIDDEAFAISWSQYRLTNKPIGRYRLKRELKNKGIDSDIINRTIKKIYSDINELDLARSLVSEKLSIYEMNKKKFDPKKIYSFLIRRGFSTEISMKIYYELANEEFNLN